MAKITVKQHDLTDCGAACLASVARHYRLNLPLARIRQYASTDKTGTNLLGLIEAAEKLGFSVKGVKCPWETLPNVPLPAIAHVVTEQGLHHYVVVYRYRKSSIEVMDPADGRLHRLSHANFKSQWTGVLLLMAPAEPFSPGNKKVSVVTRFRFLLRPHGKIMLQVLVGAACYTLLGLTTSIFLQKIVDEVLPGGNLNLLNLMGIIMVVLLLLQTFINHAKTQLTIKTGQHIDARLMLGYYKHLLRLPQRFFDTMRTGELISRINDAVKIRTFINDALITFAVNGLIIVFSFALLFSYYWKLAFVALLVIPVYALIYYCSNRINRKTQRKVMERSAEVESQLVESINAVGTVKRFGLEDYANLKTESRFIRMLDTFYRSSMNALWISNSGQFISSLLTIVVLWAGSVFVLNTQLTPGELLSFYSIIGYFTAPALGLIGINRTIQDALIAADRLFEIMDLEQEEAEKKALLMPEMVDDIRFKDVHFRYGTQVTVFSGLNLVIPKGKLTAVVGESGCGKTTLLSLLQGIYPVSDGSINIGQFDIRYLAHESLRRVVSVVPQQIDLFAGNVIDNIAVGEPEPDMRRVMQVCTDLGMTDFIERLPTGFRTDIGENGVLLSGGQRQRIAIARAIYRNPEILILDEATSSLDPAAEQHIQETLLQLRDRGKTIILIAHRLNTVRLADKIVVMQDGAVIEEGGHRELLTSKGVYYQLWRQHVPELAD
ncbi:peptidase domain-containing ABC transporter [Sphingobacterium gobiense]|uniref:Peptidase C39 n=1 Tax=Sphingobacterium gobiense TaxID=1382456 RepID=A0A2S9JUX6_9SPHI|nr:peptidase domain-containing ABC transporter [Sphingobacterium gobiense]PRD57082.1 peptidase C39 [Sphingobacterium gobiense]